MHGKIMAIGSELFPSTLACGLVVYSLVRSLTRRPVASEGAANELQFADPRPSLVGNKLVPHEKEIQFLYDKRLVLFNFRRDHEWKIYFGALWMLGAIDFAVMAGRFHLEGYLREFWPLACSTIFICVYEYERAVQLRNNSDRTSMRLLFNTLCRLAGVDDRRVLEKEPKPSRWHAFGYAFPWQIALLLVATELSIALIWA